jgi:hypothetical protein
MDNETKALAAALVLLLIAFPLTALGTERDVTWLWWAGLAVLAAGAVIPPALRFVGADDDDDNDSEDDNDDDDNNGNDEGRAR